MAKSPGHQKMPDHKVREEAIKQNIKVRVGSEVIADSNDVVKVVEDDNPPRYYFRRDDVKMDKLEPSPTTSECPFKGKASYFNLKAGDTIQKDAVWSYEQPYDEHMGLKGRVAFWEEKLPRVEITPRI